MREYGLNIVTIDDIDREAQLISKTSLPSWFKNTVFWWTNGQINDSDFINSIEFLIEEKIIKIPQTEVSIQSYSKNIPILFKSNAKLWIDDNITDGEFLEYISILIKNGIIKIR